MSEGLGERSYQLYRCEFCEALVRGEFDGEAPKGVYSSVEENDDLYAQTSVECESCSLERVTYSIEETGSPT